MLGTFKGTIALILMVLLFGGLLIFFTSLGLQKIKRMNEIKDEQRRQKKYEKRLYNKDPYNHWN